MTAGAHSPTIVERAGRPFALVLLYSILGPPIGGGLILLLFAAFAGSASNAAAILFAAPLVLTFSYILGFVPALLTGLFAAWRVWRQRAASMLAIMLVGAGASYVAPVVIHALSGSSTIQGGLQQPGALIFLLVGALAAAACRWIGRRLNEPSA